jgi:hypothetical protein
MASGNLMNRFTSLLAVVSVVLALFAAAPVAQAQVLNIDEQCAKAPDSSVCQDRNVSSNPISGTSGIVVRVTQFIALATGVVAVIMIIISGVRFITSSGDPQTVNAAKNTILYAVIGIVIVILAQAIVLFVVNYVL